MKNMRSKKILFKKLCMVAMILIGIIFITACSKDENETTLKTVVEQLYNCPNEEVIAASKEEPKVDESNLSEGGTGIVSIVEWALFDKFEELYQSYFTEDAYDKLLNERVFYNNHLNAEENNYSLEVKSVSISKNKSDDTKYDFIISVKYIPITGEEKIVDLQGSAQFSEEGKIEYFKVFTDLKNKLSE